METFTDYGIEIPYRRTSGQVKCVCPACKNTRGNPKDKSLSVNLDRAVWKCHHCGWTGSLKEYRPAAVHKLRKTYTRPAPRPLSPLSDTVTAWFSSRGISADTLRLMKISEGLQFMPQYAKECNTIQFNYILNGETVNIKYRTADKMFKMVTGAELIPYNIDAIRDTPECIITEGEIDCLSFIECGRLDCISVPNGAGSNLSYLDDFLEGWFDDKQTIYIAVDSDPKGLVLQAELLRRLGSERCKIVTYGDGCKDANEHLVKYGKQSLVRRLANARDVRIEGLFSVHDFENELDSLFQNGLQRGMDIGHKNFDALCTFETKRLCVVTGIPGSGKSEFIDEICARLNIHHGWKTAFFSPENAPLSYHASKLIEKLTGKRFCLTTLPRAEYEHAKDYLRDNFFHILPQDSYTLANILDKARYAVRRKGIKILVIDPYNRLESQQGTKSETQYISETLDKLTNFAQINDILVILMAHPKKQPKENGKIEIPNLYDISGSANFYNKADYGIIVHRHKDEDYVEVRVQKVKFRHLGQCGTALFKYNINNGRYVPWNNRSTFVEWDNTNYIAGK